LKNPGFIIVLILIFVVQILFTYIGGSVLRTVPLTSREWLFIIPACFVIIPFDIFRKLLIAPWLPKRLFDTSGLEKDDEEKESKSEDKEKQEGEKGKENESEPQKSKSPKKSKKKGD